MKFFTLGTLIAAFLFPCNIMFAGGYGYSRGYSNNCYPSYNYSSKFYVNKVSNIEFVPTFVSFVPSQVLLNGQVTTYGQIATQAQSLGYSYQGGYTNGVQQQVQPGVQLQQVGQQSPVQQYAAQPQIQQPVQQQVQTQQAQAQTSANAQAAVLTDNQRLSNLEQKLDAVLNKLGGGDPEQIQTIQILSDLNSCKKCHAVGGEGFDKLPMFDDKGQLLAEQRWFDIITAIRKDPSEPGFMPKNGQKLPADAEQRIGLHASKRLRGLTY